MQLASECAFDVLLVEDSPTDALMTREALAQSRCPITVHVVEDGVLAMRFLRRQEPYTHAPEPDLILLDLNMPRMDGREVLAELKQDMVLKHIPVIVLTSSKADEDVLKAYNLHANCYVPKPVNFHSFSHMLHCVEQFWLTVVKLPRARKER
jgi:two-component system, chemotaxis family, response regulator Rcp1